MPEPWGFAEGDYSVHDSYITQTFQKLERDGLVLESDDGSPAAMNMGLVTPAYEDLFMCFEPNTVPDKQPWKYAGICTQFDNRNERYQNGLPLISAVSLVDRFDAKEKRDEILAEIVKSELRMYLYAAGARDSDKDSFRTDDHCDAQDDCGGTKKPTEK